MLQDPFGDPFHRGAGSSLSEILRRKGGDMRPRKPVAAPAEWESEPEPAPDSTAITSKESKGDKVVLKNPRWDIEMVGFNE